MQNCSVGSHHDHNHIAFCMQFTHGGSGGCVEPALRSLIFAALIFGNAPHIDWIDCLDCLDCLDHRWLDCDLIMPMTIQFLVAFVKRIRLAFVGGATWGARHAHVCGCIHANQALNDRMRTVANVRQQLVGHAATIRTLDLMCANFFVVIVHSHPSFLSQCFLIQRFIIKFMPAFQLHMKCC